jgi:membrane carboxypeptidase/penicillin-binding protein PbpC
MIWHDAMEMLMNSTYNKKTPFNFSEVRELPINGSIDFGLAGDVIAEHKNLLPDNDLIMSPQAGDTFLKESGTTIPLVSPQTVSWYANDSFIGEGQRVIFSPTMPGNYTIKAIDPNGTSQHILIHVTVQQ